MTNLPKHVAVIMDGNGRWAETSSLPRIAGHKAGYRVAQKIVQAAIARNIHTLSLFAFSQENWRRPKSEIDFLTQLFAKLLQHEVDALHRNNVRLRIIGDLTPFSRALQDRVQAAHAQTDQNDGLQLVVAMNYSGRWDILNAVRTLVRQAQAGHITDSEVSSERFARALSLADVPASDPDLLIRTSGEQRVSNFMLWPLAYTELFFTEALWPDFTEQHLDQALTFFASRKRRFGRVGVEHV